RVRASCRAGRVRFRCPDDPARQRIGFYTSAPPSPGPDPATPGRLHRRIDVFGAWARWSAHLQDPVLTPLVPLAPLGEADSSTTASYLEDGDEESSVADAAARFARASPRASARPAPGHRCAGHRPGSG